MSFKARGNVITNNESGIYAYIPNADISDPTRPLPDFGTASDPGGNVISCNSSAQYAAADVTLDGYGTGVFPFVGNIWDHAPPTIEFWNATYPNGVDIFSYETAWSVETSVPADAGADAGTVAGACTTEHVP
jgi:hypothetical protein